MSASHASKRPWTVFRAFFPLYTRSNGARVRQICVAVDILIQAVDGMAVEDDSRAAGRERKLAFLHGWIWFNRKILCCEAKCWWLFCSAMPIARNMPFTIWNWLHQTTVYSGARIGSHSRANVYWFAIIIPYIFAFSGHGHLVLKSWSWIILISGTCLLF